jgi:hypothetical protein
LKTIGDCWDGFLVRNGFVSTVLCRNPNSDELLVKEHFDSPNNKPATKPLNEVMPSQFPHEKQVVECEWSEPPVHNLDNGHNANMKPYVDKSHKQSKQKHTALGFRNKRVGRLISRSLRNRSKPHLSSIDPIEVNEVSDPEIENFLAEEDPDCHKSDPNQPYDFVNNLPPCLKDKGEFTGIRLGPGNVTGSIDATSLDCTLHQQIVSPVHCEVCLHWIERYYIDIPILQAQIKTLTNHNELLIKKIMTSEKTNRDKLNVLRRQATL